MKHGLQPKVEEPPEAASILPPEAAHEPGTDWRRANRPDSFDWFLIGPRGLRAGWSILIFAAAFYFFEMFIGTIIFSLGLVDEKGIDSVAFILLGEFSAFLALLGTLALMGVLEGHRIPKYNLADRRLTLHLLSGLTSGFAALSLLMGALVWGGWLRFGSVALSGSRALHLAVLWGCAFLFVGSVEEGLFRCYGLFTLTRGINFWWALAAEIGICAYLIVDGGGNGANGVYAAAGLGLIPCLVLHFKNGARSAFWQAAWVTSTTFAVYHTHNSGENWVGILATASIGFVFCVSIRVTGSAWWAIGCHAAWDWGETFFYGTPDSGLAARGNYLNTMPAGNTFWSGGADGPEGSLLVLAVILVLLVVLLAVHGRRKAETAGAQAAPLAG